MTTRWANPLLLKEAFDRFRGRRAWPFLLLWIVGNGLALYLLFLIASAVNDQGFGQVIGQVTVGPFLFQAATLLLVMGVIMVLPGQVAVAIVGERERQTMTLLQVTSLSPLQIVAGKLGASLAYFGWLLLALLPVLISPFLIGGVRFGDIVGAALMLAMIAVVIGSMSIWISARSRSSRTAVAGAYLLAFALTFGSILLIGGELFIQTNRFRQATGGEIWTAIANPYMAMASAVEHPLEFRPVNTPTPFAPGYVGLLWREGMNIDWIQIGAPPDGNAVVERNGRLLVRPTRPPLWLLSALFYGGLSALCLRAAARWVTTPAPRPFRVRRRRTEPT